MGAREDRQKATQATMRAGLQVIVGKIRAEKEKLQVYVQRAWDGEELGLRDREEFYHGRLRVANLEVEKMTFMKDGASTEYVYYHGKAVSSRK